MIKSSAFISTGTIQDGVCDILFEATEEKSFWLRSSVLNHFPEISNQKPLGIDKSSFWWKRNKKGTRKRFNMVINAIRKTS